MKRFLGIDIGGTKCAVVLGEQPDDGIMRVIDKAVFLTDTHHSFQFTFDRMCDAASTILAVNGLGAGDLCHSGIACGGPLCSKTGTILSPPNLIGWDNIPITAMLRERLGISSVLQNDANACALAEWMYGAGKGYSNVVFLTFGTGMGAGLILNGKLYGGSNDMAGEIGHVRMDNHGPAGYGKAGSFEGFCSGGGIAQLARTMALEKLQMGQTTAYCDHISKLDSITAKRTALAADAGDLTAMEVYRVCGHYLGRGLSILIDVLDPEIIIIGGIYTRSGHLMQETLMETVRRESLSLCADNCKIVPAGLGEEVGDYAALSAAAYYGRET